MFVLQSVLRKVVLLLLLQCYLRHDEFTGVKNREAGIACLAEPAAVNLQYGKPQMLLKYHICRAIFLSLRAIDS